MGMKMVNKILIGATIAVLAMLIGIYIYGPILLGGPMEPLLFSLHNDDVNKHIVTVEIFDSTNKSLFNETYELDVGESIGVPKSNLKLLDRISLWTTADLEKYTFKVVLDHETEKTFKAQIGHSKLFITISDSRLGRDKIIIGQIVV